MIYFDENLVNEAIRIVELKGNKDDIKVSKDLQEINRVMALDMNNYLNMQEGIELDKRLISEYPEIQQMCDIANNMSCNKYGSVQLKSSAENKIAELLKTDRFGILAGVLIKHHIIADAKKFITEVGL